MGGVRRQGIHSAPLHTCTHAAPHSLSPPPRPPPPPPPTARLPRPPALGAFVASPARSWHHLSVSPLLALLSTPLLPLRVRKCSRARKREKGRRRVRARERGGRAQGNLARERRAALASRRGARRALRRCRAELRSSCREWIGRAREGEWGEEMGEENARGRLGRVTFESVGQGRAHSVSVALRAGNRWLSATSTDCPAPATAAMRACFLADEDADRLLWQQRYASELAHRSELATLCIHVETRSCA